jgi:predicted phage replisome organizer
VADVKWIKIAVDMFDNRKIKQIGSMPEGDSLLLMWVQLLCLAGNVNDGGFIYLTKEIPYTDEMLATQFNKPISTVRLALKTFEQFGMIEIINNMIFLSSWEKYQSTDRLTAIREKDRERKRRKRVAEKLLPQNSTEIPRTSMDVPRIDIEGDIDIDIDIDKNKSISKKFPRHKHGEYQNVLLSDDDLEKLKTKFPADWDQRIQRLSEYMASSGKSYKNHLATIRNWARRDKPAAKTAGGEDMTDLDKYF